MRYWLRRPITWVLLAGLALGGVAVYFSLRPGPDQATAAEQQAEPSYAQKRDQLMRELDQGF